MMTPKEKAEELIGKFIEITPVNYNIEDSTKQVNAEADRDFNLCKKCSMISVNEILESITRCNFKAEEIYRFWDDVKDEIKKL